MALTANKQTSAVIKRLQTAVKRDGRSLREIATMTHGLLPPERMYHSNLSKMLRQVPDTNIYVQQVLVLLNILNLDIVSLARDFRSARHARLAENIVDSVATITDMRAEVLAKIAKMMKEMDDEQFSDWSKMVRGFAKARGLVH